MGVIIANVSMVEGSPNFKIKIPMIVSVNKITHMPAMFLEILLPEPKIFPIVPISSSFIIIPSLFPDSK